MVETSCVVSIGLPVYNGEKYIGRTIQSILSQTLSDFELIICDNASKDNTEKICLEYASKDNRIRYYRNPKNIGAPANFNRVVQYSKGKYFKWAAYDDLLEPNYLSECIKILEKHPEIILCFSITGKIDESGKVIGEFEDNDFVSSKSHDRFKFAIDIYSSVWPIYGVHRRSSLIQTSLFGSYIGSDRNLFAEISLMGPVYKIQKMMFYARYHPSSYTSTYCNDPNASVNRLSKQVSWWSSKDLTYFPCLKNYGEYLKALRKAKINKIEKIKCYDQFSKWFMKEGWRLLYNDTEYLLLFNSSLARKIIPSSKKNFKKLIQH